jgi:hypothetical protein
MYMHGNNLRVERAGVRFPAWVFFFEKRPDRLRAQASLLINGIRPQGVKRPGHDATTHIRLVPR